MSLWCNFQNGAILQWMCSRSLSSPALHSWFLLCTNFNRPQANGVCQWGKSSCIIFILLPLHCVRCIMIHLKDKFCIFFRGKHHRHSHVCRTRHFQETKTISFCWRTKREEKASLSWTMMVASLHRTVFLVSLSLAIHCHVTGEEINDNNVTLWSPFLKQWLCCCDDSHWK